MVGHTRNIKMNYHKKIREGPFEILKVLGPVTYWLKLPSTWKIHPIFHVTLLRQYKETDVYGANFPQPPPDIIKGEEVYEVERILKHRKQGWGYQYYVAWKGYPIRKHRGNLNRYFQTTETSWLVTNFAINYEYASSDHLTSFNIREYEDWTNVEIGWLLRSSQTGLAVLRVVQKLSGNWRLPRDFTPPPPTFHLSTHPDTSSTKCRTPLTSVPPYLLLTNTLFWLPLNFLDSCWTKRWILL